MFMMRTFDVLKTPANKTPYADLTLLVSDEYQKGRAILNSELAKNILSDACIRVLNTPQGCYMLGHNPPLITIEQAAKFHTEFYLKTVVSIDGILMLKSNPPLMTIDEMLSVPILFSLQALVSEYGVMALKEKLITIEQAKKINFYNLQSILTLNGLTALKKGWITVDQLIKNAQWGGSWHVYFLTTKDGMECLKNGSMTYDLSQTMHDSALGREIEKLAKLSHQTSSDTVSQENVSSYQRKR